MYRWCLEWSIQLLNLRNAAVLPLIGAAGRRLAGLSNKIFQYLFKKLLIITFILLCQAKTFSVQNYKLLKSLYNINLSLNMVNISSLDYNQEFRRIACQDKILMNNVVLTVIQL